MKRELMEGNNAGGGNERRPLLWPPLNYNTPPWMSSFPIRVQLWSTASLKTLLKKTQWEKTLAKGKRVQCIVDSPSFEHLLY